MIPFLRRLIWDETVFERWCRALLALLGEGLHEGVIPGVNGSKAWWVGLIVTASALLVPAGDKTAQNLKDLSEGIAERERNKP